MDDRDTTGLEVGDIADAAGVHRQTVYRWHAEPGRRRPYPNPREAVWRCERLGGPAG